MGSNMSSKAFGQFGEKLKLLRPGIKPAKGVHDIKINNKSTDDPDDEDNKRANSSYTRNNIEDRKISSVTIIIIDV
jgi:hypothetical protein